MFADSFDRNEHLFLSIEQWFNSILQKRGHVFLNEIYDALDIPRTHRGQTHGWTFDKHTKRSIIDFMLSEKEEDGSIIFIFEIDGDIMDKIQEDSWYADY